MKFLGIILACLLSMAVCEDNVLVLTNTNFDTTITENDMVLVEFYAPWCGHCKTLEPEYEAAATTLKKEGSAIKLGKVDATIEVALAGKFNIEGYPTIKLFNKGTPQAYEGGRSADAIVKWLKKKTGPAAETIKTKGDAKAFIEKEEVVVIGFFKDLKSDSAKAFLDVANTFDDVPFGVTSDAGVFADNKVAGDAVVLFKKFDEGRNDLTTNFTADGIKSFILAHQLPLVVEFTSEAAQKIFGGTIKNHLLLFISKTSADYKKIMDEYTKATPELKEKVMFVYIDVDEAENKQVLEYFGLNEADCPVLRFISLGAGEAEEMSKYKPPTKDLDSASIKKFATEVLSGKVEKYLMSQDIPEDWDAKPVKVLVGKNFADVAKDTSKNVLVEFYAPWCGHCKELVPIWNKLAENFKDNKEIVIAKMDSTVNEAAGLDIQGFPTIKYFPKDNGDEVNYEGKRTLEALITFMESGGKEQGEKADPAEMDGPDMEDGETDDSQEGEVTDEEGKGDESPKEEL